MELIIFICFMCAVNLTVGFILIKKHERLEKKVDSFFVGAEVPLAHITGCNDPALHQRWAYKTTEHAPTRCSICDLYGMLRAAQPIVGWDPEKGDLALSDLIIIKDLYNEYLEVYNAPVE